MRTCAGRPGAAPPPVLPVSVTKLFFQSLLGASAGLLADLTYETFSMNNALSNLIFAKLVRVMLGR
jgi:hypothetical protein